MSTQKHLIYKIAASLCAVAALATSAHAATYTFVGPGTDLNTAADYSPNTGTPGSGDTVVFSGTGPNDATFGSSAFGSSSGAYLSITGSQMANLTITNTNSVAQTFRVGVNALTIASGAGSFTIGGSGGTVNFILGSTGVGNYSFINNSANTATFGPNLNFEAGGSGTPALNVHTAVFSGVGNFVISGSAINNSNNVPVAITLSGPGSLTLSGTNTYSGATLVTGGTLYASSNSALGFGGLNSLNESGTTTVTGTANTATLDLTGATKVNEAITLNGSTNGANLLVDSGSTTLSNGVAEIDFTSAGSGATGSTVTFSGGGGSGATATFAMTSGTVTGVTVTNAGSGYTSAPTLTFGAGTGQAATAVLSSLTLTGTNNTIGGAGTLNIAASVGQSAAGGGFTKAGTGTVILSGSNTFTGATTISSGTLSAAASGALGNTSSITVNTGGTLLMGGSTQGRFSNGTSAAAITLAGGTLNTNGNSEGGHTSAVTTAGLGALTQTATSTIDFGLANTGSIIEFAGVGTHSAGNLLITDYTGNAAGGGTDQLDFAGTASSFSSAYSQSQVSFDGVSGYSTVQFSGYYEVTAGAVPEPATLFSGLLIVGLLGVRERRRLAALCRVAKA